MRKRQELTEIVCRLDGKVMAEDVVVAFEKNLTNDESPERIDGIIALIVPKDNGDEPRIDVYIEEKPTETFELKKCKEFRCSSGVGCVMIEFSYDDTARMLCRADNSYSKLYAAVAKRLNHYLKTHLRLRIRRRSYPLLPEMQSSASARRHNLRILRSESKISLKALGYRQTL